MNVHRLTTLESLLVQQDDLEYILQYLFNRFDSPEKINIWLNTVNYMQWGATPASLITTGRSHKLAAYLKSVEEGY